MCKQIMMIVLMLILSYLIGAIPNGYVIGKVFLKKILENLEAVILVPQIVLEF